MIIHVILLLPKMTKALGRESIPVAVINESGLFTLAVSFIGTKASPRFVVLRIKGSELKVSKGYLVSGLKALVECRGVEEDTVKVAKMLGLSHVTPQRRVPLFFDVEVHSEVPELDPLANKLTNVVSLEIKELI